MHDFNNQTVYFKTAITRLACSQAPQQWFHQTNSILSEYSISQIEFSMPVNNCVKSGKQRQHIFQKTLHYTYVMFSKGACVALRCGQSWIALTEQLYQSSKLFSQRSSKDRGKDRSVIPHSLIYIYILYNLIVP